jgi:hypothetical protein
MIDSRPAVRSLVSRFFLAGMTALAGAASAGAAIVGSGVQRIEVNPSFYLNVVTRAYSGAASATPGWDVRPYVTTSLQWQFPTTPANSGGAVRGGGSSTTLVDNLALGTIVGPGLNYGDGGCETGGGPNAFNFNSRNNYIGFRFFNEATGQVNYGWMQVELGRPFWTC